MITVYLGSFITMDERAPRVTAVAVDDSRIAAIGTLAEVNAQLGDVSYQVDSTTFAGATVTPGLIDQHLHPILGASTLASEVIAIEDWVLPERTFKAATSQDQYRSRLVEALTQLDQTDPGNTEIFFSWGYHELWHGPLNRAYLDQIAPQRPVVIWQRSCHEWYLNTAATNLIGITEAQQCGHGDASKMVDWPGGHWWEQGMNLLLPALTPHLLTPELMIRGLTQMVNYLHRNGVTAYNEPGALFTPDLWKLYQAILGAEDTPFNSYFLVDGRAQVDNGVPLDQTIADTERQVALAPPGSGKLEFFDHQIKLFADGAIISQLMQMRQPYLDAEGHPDPKHVGAWLISPEHLRERISLFWKAGYQIHCHVNGDAGLDVLLDAFEDATAAHPRTDHRCVIVHFANSTPEQIQRIARLGLLVSANPYYTTQFADMYGQIGLGPQRADDMVRSASALAQGIGLSFHSDLPMGPSSPLGFMWCAVNRSTVSGRIAAPRERISVHEALRAVTIEAAFSWRKEDQLGSIWPGKRATFTALAEDPYAIDPMHLRDITVLGTFFEGRWFPLTS
jgi:predicted amidohydrolase YtcJ